MSSILVDFYNLRLTAGWKEIRPLGYLDVAISQTNEPKKNANIAATVLFFIFLSLSLIGADKPEVDSNLPDRTLTPGTGYLIGPVFLVLAAWMFWSPDGLNLPDGAASTVELSRLATTPRRAALTLSISPSALSMTRMPRPPPPQLALSMSG